jgi:uncharacterized protein DUF1488
MRTNAGSKVVWKELTGGAGLQLIIRLAAHNQGCSYHKDGQTMPLTRSKEQILITMNGVKFLMADGATEVPCRATRELLEDRFGSNGDQAENEKAFLVHRAAIEQVASDKYDAGQIEPHVDPKIEVTAWDMASPLSRKM